MRIFRLSKSPLQSCAIEVRETVLIYWMNLVHHQRHTRNDAAIFIQNIIVIVISSLMILKLRLISTIISMIQCIVTDRVATIIPFIKTSQNYINKVMRIFSLIESDKKIKRFYLLSFLYAFTRQVMRVFSIHTLVTPNQLNAAHSNV